MDNHRRLNSILKLKIATLSAILCAAAALAPALHAADVYWTSPSGTWFTPNGWSDAATTGNPRNAPDAADVAYISGTVTLADASATTAYNVIGTDAGTSGLLTIAKTGTLIDNGAANYIGYSVGSSGTAVVGGYWDGGPLFIGYGGAGSLIIEESGRLVTSSMSRIGGDATNTGTGYALVEGYWKSASTLAVGFGGTGYLEIAETGTLFNNNFYAADQNASTFGQVDVAGFWQSNQFIIGQRGTGIVNVAETGIVHINNARINTLGNYANSLGIMNVAGYYNANTGTLYVGASGTGVLDIKSTGTVVNGIAYVGNAAGSSGTVNVAGLWKNSSNVFIGNSGDGSLNIASTGTGTVGGYVRIGQNVNSSGTVVVDGLLQVTGTNVINTIGYYGNNAGENDAAATGVLIIGQTGTAIFSGSETSLGHLGMASGTTYRANASGTAIVDGVWLLNNSNLLVGRSGHGHLKIGQSGTVLVDTFSVIASANSVSNASHTATDPIGGTAIVDGYFGVGTYLTVGNSAPGSLEIGQTGTVKAGSYIRIAGNAAGTGIVTVAGLLDIGASLAVGYAGTGTLEILSGGTVIQRGQNNYVASAISGAASNGNIIIRSGGYLDAGARNNATQANFGIGWVGQGSLFIEAGGTAVAAATTSNNVAFSLGYTGYGTGTIAGTLAAATGYSDIGQSGTGVLTIENGGLFLADRLRLASAAATARGTLVLNGGILETRQIIRGLGTATILYNGGTLRAGANTDDFFSNFPTLDLGSDTLTLDTNGFTVTATNTLASASAAATLNKIGSGSLVLTGNSSAYTGALNINAGSLILGNSALNIGGSVTIASGAAIDAATSATISSLTLADGAIWNYSLETPATINTTDLIIGGGGSLILDRATLDIAGIIPGNYTLATYTSITGDTNLSSWLISGADFAVNATFDTTSSPGTLIVNIGSAFTDYLNWQGGDGEWNATNTNWLRSSTPVVWNYGAVGVFDAGAGNVTVTGQHILSGLRFDDVVYTLAGTGTLTSFVTATLNATAATGTGFVNTALDAPSIVKTGAGHISLGGNTAITGTTFVEDGTLGIGSDGVLTTSEVRIEAAGGGEPILRVAGTLNNSGNLFIGHNANGALVVANGGVVNQAVETYIGRAGTGSGLLLVENGGTFYQTTGYFRIAGGAAGDTSTSGTLIIQNGGVVDITSNIHIGAYGSGTVLIDGYLGGGASSYIGVYAGGQGMVTIGQTGTFNGAGLLTIGYNATSSGTLIVEGLAKVGTNLYLGYGTNATGNLLDIKNTGTVTVGSGGYIGNAGGSSGSANVAGLLDVTGTFGVGMSGTGYLDIADTGTVKAGGIGLIGNVAGSSGAVSVAGSFENAGNLYVGNNGTGYLDIADTGTAKTGGIGFIGNAAGSSGTANVAGLWNITGNLAVGMSGAGYLNIAEGGTVSNAIAALGWSANGSGIADVAGLWDIRSNLNLANNATNTTGTLNIASTGTVKTTTYVSVGHAATGVGSATVSGKLDIGTNLFIGNTGTGTLDLQSGGAVIVTGTTTIGFNAAGTGTLALNGGVLQTTQLAKGAGASTILFNGGTLRAAASTDEFFLNFDTLDLGDGALGFDTNGFTITATNALAGTIDGKLVKTGSGSLVLTADSTAFTGTINVQKGALVLAADPVTTTGAKLNKVYVDNGGSIRSSAADATINTLTIASGGALDMRTAAMTINDSITLADGAIWRYSLTGTHALNVASSGTLIFDGDGTFILDRDGLNIDSTLGLYTIANYYAISGTDNLLGWDIAGGDFSVDDYNIQFDLSSTPNAIKIFIGDASVDRLLWQGGNGDWDTTSTTWKRGNASDVWSDGAFAIFDTGTGIVNVTGLHTVYALQFGDITSVDYTLNGTGTLTSLSAAEIKVVSTTDIATINTAIKTPGLNKSGLGTLVLGGNATFDGAALVKNGALEVSTTGTMTATEVLIEGVSPTVRVAGVLTNSGTLQIGGTLNGALVVANGGVVNQRNQTIVGTSDTGAGLLHVETGGLFKQTSGYLRIGGGAAGEAATSGTLIVETGGTVNSANHIHIGAYGSGTALIDGNLVGNGNTYIGVYEGGQGIATIGNDGTLDTAGSLTIGYDATGTLTVAGLAKAGSNLYIGQNAGSAGNLLDITSSGTVTVGSLLHIGSNGSGTALIDGHLSNATNAYIGTYADSRGAVSIGEDGVFKVGNNLTIGYNATATGTASVAGLLDITGTLFVGDNGAGALDITSTGTVSITTNAFIGNNIGSSGTVNVAGYYTAGGEIRIGNSGTGIFTVLNGGSVYHSGANTTRIGYAADSYGSLTIKSGGVWTGTGGFSVGYSGTGFLYVEENASLTTDATCLYIAHTANSYGYVQVDGYYRSGNNGAYYQPVGYADGSVGIFNLGITGTAITAGIDIGREAGATGTVTIDGYWRAAGSTPVGNSGTGTLIIGTSGTLIAGLDNTYVAAAVSGTNSHGTIIVHGYLDSGTRNNATLATLSIGHGGTGILDISENGTVIAAGTGADTLVMAIGQNANASGTVNVAGRLILNDGNAINGNNGTGVLNIASTGTVVVGGRYTQSANGTLIVAAASNRSSAYITTESASLSGTLALDSSGLGYAGFAKASEITEAGVLILNATSGTIGGGFTTVTGVDGAGLPDYLSIGGQTKINDDNTASYYAGYRLTWNALTGAHGDFTLNDGETFEVDTPLANRYGELAPGWDGKSLTKKGAGTLILSGQNTFTGTLTVSSGTLRLGGPADHSYNALVNNAVLDFGSRPLGRAIGETYRTAQVSSLDGNGTLRMTANPGTGQSDRLIVTGNATGVHRLIITASDDATMPSDASPTTVLATVAGRNNATFTGGLDFGGINYLVAQSATPGQIILATNGQAGVADPIRGIPGAQSLMWFASQDNLSRRLGELRGLANEPERDLTLWIRARAEQSKFNSGTNMRPFEMDLYGFELGADSTLALSAARLAFGFYLGYGHAEQDFDPRAGTGTADGKSDQFNIGAYASWMHDAGWFSSLTIAIANYDNSFESADQSGNRTRGDYDDKALGASLEFGKRIALDNMIGAGWFAEPSAQLSAVYFSRGGYDTTGANRLDIDGDSATIARFRGTVRAGRAWHLGSGHIELAARIGGAHETSTGGEVNIGASHWRPNVDGTRGEAGVGLIWRPAPGSQVYFDYEFATGDAYQKPWSISLGYRHAF